MNHMLDVGPSIFSCFLFSPASRQPERGAEERKDNYDNGMRWRGGGGNGGGVLNSIHEGMHGTMSPTGRVRMAVI